jgi:hypothetical protein
VNIIFTGALTFAAERVKKELCMGTWECKYTCLRVCVCVCVCMCVCVCVCMCVCVCVCERESERVHVTWNEASARSNNPCDCGPNADSFASGAARAMM